MSHANEQSGREDLEPNLDDDSSFMDIDNDSLEQYGDNHKEAMFDAIKKMEFSREAEIFKALGHPIRLKIVYGLLMVGGCNVKNMQECLGLHQATVSQHLIHLKTRGIIQSSRQGLEMVYSVTDTWAKCIVDNIERNRVKALEEAPD
ncbi:MAG: metalloregulator ArsR/SmtB family transcription factor [Desulfomonilaceae bacterium]